MLITVSTHDTLGVQVTGPEAVEVATGLLPVLGVHALVGAEHGKSRVGPVVAVAPVSCIIGSRVD